METNSVFRELREAININDMIWKEGIKNLKVSIFIWDGEEYEVPIIQEKIVIVKIVVICYST